MDNRIFNVNGSGKAMLADVLRIALLQEHGCRNKDGGHKAVGYRITSEHGLILLWHVDTSVKGNNSFITPLGADALAEMLGEWLATAEAREAPHTDWDVDSRHDGDNSHGWRVYCESWGHVAGDPYAIVAIKHAFMWHGK